MDASTGEIIWSTANPSNATSSGLVMVANGVVFSKSTNGKGPIYTMNTKTGKIVWLYETGATIYGDVSISRGCVYFGNKSKWVFLMRMMAIMHTALNSVHAFGRGFDVNFETRLFYCKRVAGTRTVRVMGSTFMAERRRGYNMHLINFLATISLILVTANLGHGSHDAQDWLNHGGDLRNRRHASKETKISPKTVSKLYLKWKFDAGRDITATPAIYKGNLYFPSWEGYLYALKASNGSLIWKQNLQQLTGVNGTNVLINVNTTVARATPTIADDLLIIGITGPAVVIAVKRATGELVWKTMLDHHPAGLITMSGTYYKGGFYIGTSSEEEETTTPTTCCTFRGSLAKLDVRTGAILWKTFTLPDNHGKLGGYAGAGIWGSSPSIDKSRNLVYVATGNLYSVPSWVSQCQEEENNQTTPTHPDRCIEPEIHSESFLALDLDSGEIKWYRQLGGYDVWFLACNNLSKPDCPIGPSLDADFGEAPMMLTIHVNGTKKDLVVATQKNGFAWALDRDNGDIIWSTEAGPGGVTGGGTWGSATDQKRVYTNIANSDAKNFTLKPSKSTTTFGGWVAMDASTGEIIWSMANPSNATAYGPVTVANGVVFAGSTNGKGPIYAMNAKTGKILWSYETGATIYGGVSVSRGCIYFGNGYRVSLGAVVPSFTAGKSLFAFCV
ncbi:hypothetical protein Ancab_019903 [Ancistrocladus abbreviatus]